MINTMKIKKLGLIALFVVVFAVNTSYAQERNFEATVDRSHISLGESVQLTLTFEGVSNTGPLELPEIDGFQTQYLGPSTKVTIINGNYSKTTAYVYNLLPLKTGTFEVPALRVEIKGKTYISNAIKIKIVDSSEPTRYSTQGQAGDRREASLDDKISLVLQVPKNEVYMHEQVPITVKLYIQGLSVSDVEYPEFEKLGFSIDEYSKPRQYEEVKGGLRYEVIEFNATMYPTRTGEITLGPASLQCNILSRSQQRSRRGFDSFFDDFFDHVEKHPIAIQSIQKTINVLPFPQTGKPKEFSGAIGRFTFDLSASPVDVKVGDPITIRMNVSGSGNLRAVKLPAFTENDLFKVYKPQIKEENGEKVLEQVLIPKSESIKEIPEVVFSYFDTQRGRYKSISKGPLPLKVSPADEQGEIKVFESQKGEKIIIPETFGRDIVFIKEKPGKFQIINHAFYKSTICKLLFLFLTIIFISGYLYYLQHNRLRTDVAFARRLRASKTAKVALDQAKELINTGKYKEFYANLFKLLQEYFGNKFHLSSQGLTVKELEKALKTKKIDDQVLNKVKALLDQCDQVRFASAKIESYTMMESLKQSELIVDYFERNVR